MTGDARPSGAGNRATSHGAPAPDETTGPARNRRGVPPWKKGTPRRPAKAGRSGQAS